MLFMLNGTKIFAVEDVCDVWFITDVVICSDLNSQIQEAKSLSI